jgi:hypothetical protein
MIAPGAPAPVAGETAFEGDGELAAAIVASGRAQRA